MVNFPFALRKSDNEDINTGIIKKKFSPEYTYRTPASIRFNMRVPKINSSILTLFEYFLIIMYCNRVITNKKRTVISPSYLICDILSNEYLTPLRYAKRCDNPYAIAENDISKTRLIAIALII